MAFLTVTVLASGPLLQVDLFLNQPWQKMFLPGTRPLFQHVLDKVAGQSVDLPLLAVVALTLAWRRRTWRPILVGTAIEIGWLCTVGVMKIIFARPAPGLEDPAFFNGGILSDGWYGMSYPSGHASEAVLFYGAAVYLIARYSAASTRAVRWLIFGVALVTVNAVGTSFIMGWHWMTDLVGGMLAGGLLLRLIADADTAIPGKPRSSDGPGYVDDLPGLAEEKVFEERRSSPAERESLTSHWVF